jgi:hypothetical protein
MHDPMIVAHEIKYPWFAHRPWPRQARRDPNPFALRRAWEKMTPAQRAQRSPSRPEGYRDTFITVWHVDPERDGTDDSCGYSYVKLTKKQRERLRNAAWHEGHNPHFLCCREKEWTGTQAEAEALHRGLVFLICRVLRLKITFDEAAKFASEATHILDCGKAGGAFCFLPGYHTNSQKDSIEEREDHFCGIMCNVARNILTERRRWWQHPKWHFWHWKIQCRPLLTFKRWAFSRCSKCGKRFAWGYNPVTNSWDGTGPRWFKSERDTFHSDCSRPYGSGARAAGLAAKSHLPFRR